MSVRHRLRPLMALLVLAAGVALFAFGNRAPARPPPAESMLSVALPVPLQMLYAGGDRYLAANVGAWRAIMVGTGELPAATLRALAQVQEDVSWLNPWHEDNYYTAAAILPWAGELAPTQTILRRATAARRHDVYPPFYYAFNQWYFAGDVAGGVASLLVAAEHSRDPGERQALTVMAARWSEQSDETATAIAMVHAMAERTRDRALKDYLGLREQRLHGLLTLRQAAQKFAAEHGRAPRSLDEMLAGGLVARIPEDPLGGGYAVRDGVPILLPAVR